MRFATLAICNTCNLQHLSLFKVGISLFVTAPITDTDGSPGGQICQNLYFCHLMSDFDAVKPKVTLSNL